jgi:tryptophan synthase alpha chain
LEQVLEMLQTTSPNLRSPIILFPYYNPILHRGIERFLQQIAAAGVARLGVTGIRSQMETRVSDLLKQIRGVTDKLIGVGFGIFQVEQARQVKDWGADIVIVGSAFVKWLANGTPEQGLSAIADFCQSLKSAIKTVNSGTNTHLVQTDKLD